MCVGLAKWANFIGFGLGTVPDFKTLQLDLSKSAAASVSRLPSGGPFLIPQRQRLESVLRSVRTTSLIGLTAGCGFAT